LLDSLYGQVMRVRRRWVERHPGRRRHLARPVISVGNLSMGGTGKSPVVAAIAQWLIAAGERPSILSRGYGRADEPDGVVVVADGSRILAAIDQAGDEPLMLARQVPGACVCVSPDRYLSGTLAERQLGCTVHILDDGFQHIQLARALDVLVTTIGEIPQGKVIPFGRLREPMDAAARAHVLVVSDATAGAATAEAWRLGISQSCGTIRSLGSPVLVNDAGAGVPGATLSAPSAAEPVFAVAAIANPSRFADSVRAAGWNVAGTSAFSDHHRYSRADLDRIGREAQTAGARVVFTTDKDAVRFEPLAPLPFPLYRLPLVTAFDPADVLFESVRAAIRRGTPAVDGVPSGARR
jgi:tetraacyldisaccharide 4'-kinase